MSFFRSLRGKVLLFFLLIDLATVGALIFTVSGNAREALEQSIGEQLRLESRISSTDIEEELAFKWSFMQSLAGNTFLINSVTEPRGHEAYLAPFMQRLQLPGLGGEVSDVWVLDAGGRVIARNGLHPAHPESSVDFAREPWWPGVSTGQPAVALVQREGRSRLLYGLPLSSQGRTLGAVVSEFDVALLRETAAREGFGVTLLSEQGPLFGPLSPEALRRVWNPRAVSGEDSTFLLGDTFYLVAPLKGFSREHGLVWSLVLSAPAERILRPLQELRQRMMGAGAVLAVVFAGLVIWGTRLLLRPLGRIEGTLRRIVDGGDLSQRVRLQSRDELGSIARTFDQMMEKLEHRTAELERSRDELALLAHITSASPAAIAMCDLQGHAHVWNEAAARLFGWSQEEISERPFLERLVPASQQGALAELMTRSGSEGPVESEVGLLSRTQGAIPVQLLVTRIADAAAQPLGYVFIMRDQREVKRLRESLVQSEKMAAMGTLVAGLSHELNNPLGIILGFAQGMARRSTLDDGSRTAVAAIERQAQRCAQLVRALLDFSRNKVPFRERVAVPDLFARLRELVQGQARRANIELEILTPPGELPELEVCVQEIESALLNLLANALDATPSGGSVSMSARAVAQDTGIEVVVTDTGCGMSEEVLQRAFDPFFTTKPVGQGTGLGLSITRNIVEAHGGAIDVKTAPGAGTTVRLWLPAAGAPPQAQRMEATAWK
ncbi:ATP-binding protein [Hyalangium gracile]|uniref:ATP-binding protein n=1 Tax=Hyalangium gracile TaxID=394092 RepID=UPI001CCD09B3|nr:ATP-binding protein [Hyalangium gracile]